MMGSIINSNKLVHITQVLPLSLLALRQSIRCLQIPRNQQPVDITPIQVTPGSLLGEDMFSNYHFGNSFWRHVKLKKRHEIELMAKMCYKLAIQSNCYYIVDVGSGLGHLSRMLSYGYGLQVFSLEAQEYLTEQASKLDQEIEDAIKRYCKQPLRKNLKPIHIHIEVKTTSNGDDILKAVEEALENKADGVQFGIVGLHPCGDLGATLLRFFTKSQHVKFINIVGCCYMKLSTTLNPSHNGYPLSEFCKRKKFCLSYCSREIACHALEAYVEKLSNGQCSKLKIHAYRAALEKLITNKWPHLFHSQVCSVKCSEDLTFTEYCTRAISKLGIELDQTEMKSSVIRDNLACWKYVVVFYSLRLMIAPIIETMILLDRLLFILESDMQCHVTSIFDPMLSPRNQVLTGIK